MCVEGGGERGEGGREGREEGGRREGGGLSEHITH